MTRGSFKVAVQRGNAGFFADVAVDVEWRDSTGLEVVIGVGESPWVSGVRFGLEYAYEHVSLPTLRSPGLRVFLVEIRGHAVDTTMVVVAYAAMNALWNALGIRPRREPSFDEDTGLFTFPK